MRGMRFASMAAVVVAGVTFAAACASAATVGPAAAGPSMARAVHFSGFSQNSDGPDFTVVLSGAVGDYGPAVSIHPDGTVDPEHTSSSS